MSVRRPAVGVAPPALLAALALVNVSLAAGAHPPVALTRGPYLQLVTQSGAIVRWRTDAATPSRVLWGPAPGQLVYQVVGPAFTTEHEVRVEGLEVGARAYYAVGTDSEILAGDDGDHFILTAPVAGEPVATRVWAIGDSGTGSSEAEAVRDAYLAFTGATATDTDVWLMLGDNAYPAGTDDDYQLAVFTTYAAVLRQVGLWPSIGNHDALSSDSSTQTGPYFASFTLPAAGEAGGVASDTEAYYSFDHANVHFVCLDSADSDLGTGSDMLQWLQLDLAANRQDWLVAFLHHPPYTKGSHDSDDPGDSGGRMFAVRENVLPLLEAAGADLVLAGHSHNYERSYLLHGHYGTSDTLEESMILDHGDGRVDGDGPYTKAAGIAPGTVYVVAGCAGVVYAGPLNHPAMYTGFNQLGSVVLDFAGDRLDARFLDDVGAVRDELTIAKPRRAIFADGFEAGSTARWSATVPVGRSAARQ